jgi:ATP-binding cassette subfamily F protein 3
MIHLTGISKQYGTRVLYSDSSFQVREGDKIGLVGPNGAGKSTIFRIIVGEEGIDSGEVNIAERAVIGYLYLYFSVMKCSYSMYDVMAFERSSDTSPRMSPR